MLSMPKRKAVAVEEDIAENEVVVPNSAESMSIFRTPLSKSYQSLEKCIKIISWNVAGIRGTLKNKPSVFTELVQVHLFAMSKCSGKLTICRNTILK